MLLPFPSIYLWVAILIAAVAIEAFTMALVSIWFGGGALAALIAASCGLNIASQMIVFVIVSALLLLLVRPFTRKFLRVRNVSTNADRIIDQTALVTLEINNALSQGQIKLLGQSWSARSADNSVIPEGAEVRVLAISGVKAVVEACRKQTEEE